MAFLQSIFPELTFFVGSLVFSYFVSQLCLSLVGKYLSARRWVPKDFQFKYQFFRSTFVLVFLCSIKIGMSFQNFGSPWTERIDTFWVVACTACFAWVMSRLIY